jgi:hypothetical protein
MAIETDSFVRTWFCWFQLCLPKFNPIPIRLVKYLQCVRVIFHGYFRSIKLYQDRSIIVIIENDCSVIWNSNCTTFTNQLFSELLNYNVQKGSVEVNNRFVSLDLNFTEPAKFLLGSTSYLPVTRNWRKTHMFRIKFNR